MEGIQLLGYRPVPLGTLTPVFAEAGAQLAIEGPRGPISEFDMLRRIITPEILENLILKRINDNFQKRIGECGAGEASRYKPCTEEEWWAFFARLLLDRLEMHGRGRALAEAERNLTRSKISDHRFTALRQAHAFAENDIVALGEGMRRNLRGRASFGNYAVVDETMIEYRGHDMRELGIDIHIPGKPHDYGMLRYCIAVRLLYSGMPLLVDFDMRLPTHKIAGPEAFDRLVRRNFFGPVHVYADSLFAGPTQIGNFRRSDVRVTISFGDNAEGPLRDLRGAALPFLGRSHTLTFSSPHYVVQLTGGAKAPTSVLSSFWAPTVAHPEQVIDADRHAMALALFSSDASDAAIRSLFSLPGAVIYDSRAHMVSAWLGWDIWKPTPGPGGLQYTENNLNDLSKPLLQILHNTLPHCSGGARMKKADLIKDILKNSPYAAERRTVAQWIAEEQSVDSVHEKVLGSPHAAHDATGNYCRNYNLIDRHDRIFYQLFGTSYLAPWNSCLVVTFLFQQVINAYALHVEHVQRREQQNIGRVSIPNPEEDVASCAQYVLAVIRACNAGVET